MNKFFNSKILYVVGGTLGGMVIAGYGVKTLTGKIPYTKELVGTGLFAGGSMLIANGKSADMKRVATGLASVGGTVVGSSLYQRMTGSSLPALEDSNSVV